MTVRSAVLVHGNPAMVANVAQTIATCPVGEVWILKDLSLRNANATTAATVGVVIRRGTESHDIWGVTIPGGGVVSSTPRFVVMEAGDELRLNSTLGSSLRLWAAGARLVT